MSSFCVPGEEQSYYFIICGRRQPDLCWRFKFSLSSYFPWWSDHVDHLEYLGRNTCGLHTCGLIWNRADIKVFNNHNSLVIIQLERLYYPIQIKASYNNLAIPMHIGEHEPWGKLVSVKASRRKCGFSKKNGSFCPQSALETC